MAQPRADLPGVLPALDSGRPQTYFTFEDTLTQIGLGYTFCFLLAFRRARAAVDCICGASSSAIGWPGRSIPHRGQASTMQQSACQRTGTTTSPASLSHWNKNSNLGQAFDRLVPQSSAASVALPVYNDGGYLTLSFIPTLGTMILGLRAGEWFREAAPTHSRSRSSSSPAQRSACRRPGCCTSAGICPIVKRIWTPAWTLCSGGVCFLFLAAFSWIIDVKGYRRWAFPLVVVGMNSIAAYLIAHLWEDFLIDNLHIHFSRAPFQIFGPGYEPLLTGIAVMLLYWSVLYWMYRRKLFLRV